MAHPRPRAPVFRASLYTKENASSDGGHTLFFAEFVFAAGPVAVKVETGPVRVADRGELSSFKTALTSGAGAWLKLEGQSGDTFWIELEGDVAALWYERRGPTGGGLGPMELLAERAAALQPLSKFVTDWGDLCPELSAGP